MLVVLHTQLVTANLQNLHIGLIIELSVEVCDVSNNFDLNSIFPIVSSLLKIGRIIIDKKPELSSFAEHYITKHNLLSNSLINNTNPFTLSILYKYNSYLDRKIREAMFIKQLKPKLNKNIGLYLTS